MDIVDQLMHLLQQLVIPNWPDLILLLPWVLIVIVVAWLVFTWWQWRSASDRNRSRVPKPRPGGKPPAGVHLPGPSRWPFVAPIGAAILLFSFVLPPKDAAGDTIGLFNFWVFLLGLVILLIAFIGWLRDASREWRATAEPRAAVHGLPAGSNASVALMPSHGMALRRAGAADIALIAQPEVKEPPAGVHMPGPSPWPFLAPFAMAVLLYGVIFSSVLIFAGLILAVIAMTGWYLEAGREYRTTEEFGHPVPATRDPVRAWPRRLARLYAVVIAVAFVVTLAPVGFGYLNSLTPAEATPTPISVPAVPEISASSAVSFDTKLLIVPAGRPFDLVFNNNNAGVPHNVQIDDSSARTKTFFDGDEVTGVASVTYHVPALEVGDYYFLCRIHPNMNGTLTAMTETGGQPGGQVSPAPQASSAP